MAAHEKPQVMCLNGTSTLQFARGAMSSARISEEDLTLAIYANRWLSNLAGRRPRTIEKYTASLVLHVLPRLGGKRLDAIGPDDIVALAKELHERGYSEWTVDTTLAPLEALFRHAVRRDVLAVSPFHKLERAERPRPSPTSQRVLSAAEIHDLLAAAPSRYRLLIATAIFTGLRQSELLALRWEDIDFDAAVVRVRTALDRNRQHVPLKTRAARRDVILVPALSKDLEEERARSEFPRDTDYVFPSSVGTPLIWRNVSPRGLAPAAEAASVGRLRWHDLRHTFASILIANGSNVVFVSRQVGHSSPETTLRVYGHLWEIAEQGARTRTALNRVYTKGALREAPEMQPVSPGQGTHIRQRTQPSNKDARAPEETRVDARLRRQSAARAFKPDVVDVLLVNDAPPSRLDRYFYFANVTDYDSLFRYVCRGVLEIDPVRSSKPALLSRLRENGVFLIDLQDDPLDSESSPRGLLLPRLIERCRSLQPRKIILIKTTLFDAVYPALRNAGLPVSPLRIPFPASGRQREFEAAFGQALHEESDPPLATAQPMDVSTSRPTKLLTSSVDSRPRRRDLREPSMTAGVERAPYRLTIAATAALFEREPERLWSNNDVLEALLDFDPRADQAAITAALLRLVERGLIVRRWRSREAIDAPFDLEFRVDRAAVNVALADLANNGLISRIQRGLYTSTP